jgi:hypothetical protein
MFREGILDAALARGKVRAPFPSADTCRAGPGPSRASLRRGTSRALDRSGPAQKGNRDRIAAGGRRGEEMLERKLAGGLARAPFDLTAVCENNSGFRMR